MEIKILRQPGTLNLSGNPIPFTVALTPYGITERRQDIRVQIRIESGLTLDPLDPGMQELWSQILYPDLNGKVEIDARSVCDAYLEYHTPRLSLHNITTAPRQCRPFRIVAFCTLNGQTVDLIKGTPFMVLKGGLSYEEFHPTNFFTNYLGTQKKPLHFFAEKETCHLLEKKFLYWMPLVAPDPDVPGDNEMRVRLKMYYSDGTDETRTSANGMAYSIYNVYIAPFGFRQVLNLMTTRTHGDLVKYEVSIVATAGRVIINPITFFVDYRNNYNDSALLFRNSVGGLDTTRILGEIEFQAEYDSTSAQRIPPPSGIRNALLQPQIFNTENIEQEKFIGSTEFIAKDKHMLLRDLLLSKQVHEVKNNRLVPVVLIKKTAKFFNSKDNLLAMQIEWMHAFVNEFFTPLGAIVSSATCPALTKFEISQNTKSSFQVMWSMPMPYDMIELEIDNGNPAELQTVYLPGNTTVDTVVFTNPAVYPGTASITIKARVVCDFDSDPKSFGPQTTVTVPVLADTAPVAIDDLFSLEAGFNTAQVLSGSVMDNDYDTDFDELEVVAASGATAAGGSYSISSAGVVTYTPPASNYNGQDSFTYTVRQVATPALSATATVRINVGNQTFGAGTYVKIVERNHWENNSGGNRSHGGSFFITFWQDPMATIPKVMPVPAGYTKIRVKKVRETDNNNDGTWTFVDERTYELIAIGTEMPVYSGVTYIRMAPLGVVSHQLRSVITILAHVPGDGEQYIPV